MSNSLKLVLVLMLLSVPSLAQKVYIDFDREVEFRAYRTFAFFDHEENNLAVEAPLVHDRIVSLIREKMTEAGLEETDAEPDLLVTYHTNVREEMEVSSVSLGYGYGPERSALTGESGLRGGSAWGWTSRWAWSRGYATVGVSELREHSYVVGTLIVDLWDRGDNELVWRGVTEGTVKPDPEKSAEAIERSLYRMGKLFRKKYRKVEKARERN